MLMWAPMTKHLVRLVLLLCLEVGLHKLRMKFQAEMIHKSNLPNMMVPAMNVMYSIARKYRP